MKRKSNSKKFEKLNQYFLVFIVGYVFHNPYPLRYIDLSIMLTIICVLLVIEAKKVTRQSTRESFYLYEGEEIAVMGLLEKLNYNELSRNAIFKLLIIYYSDTKKNPKVGG